MAETWHQVVFWIIAATMVVAALRVVTTRNIMHAALYLVATLLGAAGLYILLLAEFLAWAQVLVYVGAIVVLMLFGLMLTRAPIGSREYDNDQRLVAAVVAGLVFAVTSWILIDAFAGQRVDLVGGTVARARDVGAAIFRSFVLPFEAISILLLAALIGAVMIARRDDPDAEE